MRNLDPEKRDPTAEMAAEKIFDKATSSIEEMFGSVVKEVVASAHTTENISCKADMVAIIRDAYAEQTAELEKLRKETKMLQDANELLRLKVEECIVCHGGSDIGGSLLGAAASGELDMVLNEVEGKRTK